MDRVDFVVVGQGLAGTTLARRLAARGRRVLVVDRGGDGASRIAAGLITPVTGKRLAKSWRWDELYPAAVAYYRDFERDTGVTVLHQRPALRLFASAEERDEFGRRAASVLTGLVRKVEDIPDAFAAPFGGFEMPPAARRGRPRPGSRRGTRSRRRAAPAAARGGPRAGVLPRVRAGRRPVVRRREVQRGEGRNPHAPRAGAGGRSRGSPRGVARADGRRTS